MAYVDLSRYNGFGNQSKEMGGKIDRVVGGPRHSIVGLDVSEGGRRENGDPIFGRSFS